MEHHRCTVCGYVYKPERGDWTHEIPADTPFEKLPEAWRCPTCNQPKMAFEKVTSSK